MVITSHEYFNHIDENMKLVQVLFYWLLMLVNNPNPYFWQDSTCKSSSVGQSPSIKLRVPQKKLANGNGSRQLPIGRVPSRGPMKQRLHPGMLSTQDRATAHYGAVTGLKVTEDGMYLLSAGLFISYCIP